MPYSTRKRRRGYGTKRRRRYKRRRMGHMTARRVRRIIDAELKHGTLGVNGDAPAVTGSNVALTLINPGTGASARIGNWIKVKNIHGCLQVEGQNNGTIDVVNVRAFIFRWNENESTNVPTLDVLVNNTTAPMGPYNFESRKMFTVVWSRVFSIVNKENNTQFNKKLPFYVRPRGPKTIYNGGVPAKFQYFFWIFSETDTADSIPSFRLDITTRWTDS